MTRASCSRSIMTKSSPASPATSATCQPLNMKVPRVGLLSRSTLGHASGFSRWSFRIPRPGNSNPVVGLWVAVLYEKRPIDPVVRARRIPSAMSAVANRTVSSRSARTSNPARWVSRSASCSGKLHAGDVIGAGGIRADQEDLILQRTGARQSVSRAQARLPSS